MIQLSFVVQCDSFNIVPSEHRAFYQIIYLTLLNLTESEGRFQHPFFYQELFNMDIDVAWSTFQSLFTDWACCKCDDLTQFLFDCLKHIRMTYLDMCYLDSKHFSMQMPSPCALRLLSRARWRRLIFCGMMRGPSIVTPQRKFFS